MLDETISKVNDNSSTKKTEKENRRRLMITLKFV